MGALVLNCFPRHFWHPARGVLRCQDSLSLAAESVDLDIFAGHLALARDGALPVRVVRTPAPVEDEKNSTRARGYNVRPDLVGKVVKFDGDCFIVDFTRREAIDQRAVIARRK